MIEDLIKIANKLDQLGLIKEADFIDKEIARIAQMKKFATKESSGGPSSTYIEDVSRIANSFMIKAIRSLGEPDPEEEADLRSSRDEMVEKIFNLIDKIIVDVNSQKEKEIKAIVNNAIGDAVRTERRNLELSIGRQVAEEIDSIIGEANNYWKEIHAKTRGRGDDTARWDHRVDGAYGCAKVVAHQGGIVKSKFTDEPFDYQKIDDIYDNMLKDFRMIIK